MPSAEHDAILELIRATPGFGDPDRTLEEARANLDAMGDIMPVGPEISVVPVDAGGVPAEWVAAPGVPDEAGVVVYLHGGAYTQGSLDSHRSVFARLSAASGRRVLGVDYRLAPEHPFPGAVDDAVAAYRWVLDGGAASGDVVIAGDSAGGGLTAATLVALRDAGHPLPAGGVMMSPWVDLTLSGGSMDTKADADPMCSRESLRPSAEWYAGDTDRAAPLVSPLFADLSGLPPMLILVGTAEVLLDDSIRLADRARAAGVDVELDVGEDLLHVYPVFPGVPESEAALARIGAWIAAR